MAPSEVSGAPPTLTTGLNAVIIAVTDLRPRVLTVQVSGQPLRGLPFGPLDPARHRTLELGLREWVLEQTGLELGYVEQLYTFGDRDRVPTEWRKGVRVLSIAYLALVREQSVAGQADAQWRDIYDYLPWEDWRRGAPGSIEREILPGLDRLSAAAGGRRKELSERIGIAFARRGLPWDTERVLERYELLYEGKLVAEARAAADELSTGRALVFDHRRIMATALGRLRGKIKYRPIVFEMLPEEFTLFQLQQLVEALAGVRLHKQNFRRLVDRGGLVEGTGRQETETGGRPAELFRFRREVLRERLAPGVGLPIG